MKDELIKFKENSKPSAKKLYDFFKKKIKNFVMEEIDKLEKNEKFALHLFLKISPELVSITELWENKYEKHCKRFFKEIKIDQDKIIKILIRVGLLLKRSWNSTENKFDDYHYPEYFDELKEILLDNLGKCLYCGAKISPRANICPKCGDPYNEEV